MTDSATVSASSGGTGGTPPAIPGSEDNVCPAHLATALDPDRPGPTDLLSKAQYRRYRVVYDAHNGEPGEKHAAAWSAAVAERRE